MSNFFIEPLDDIKQYSSFSADIDLTANAQSPVAKARGHARFLRVESVAAGTTLVVRMAGNSSVDRTLTVAAGYEFVGKFVAIDAATDVTRITVGW